MVIIIGPESANVTLAQDESPPRCLLCQKGYKCNKSLTRHYRQVHIPQGHLDLPFDCPECAKVGKGIRITGGCSVWSNHIGRYHGDLHAPRIPTHGEKRVKCFFCARLFASMKARRAHFRMTHYNKQDSVHPVSCSSCSPPEGLLVLNTFDQILKHEKLHDSMI